MPAKYELLVGLLELAAFFLVTPEVIGQARLERLYGAMSRITAWLRGIWFGHDFGPFAPSTLVPLLLMFAAIGALTLGLPVPENRVLLVLIYAAPTFLPATFILLFWLLRALRRRERLGRVMAVIGAGLFVLGRLIVIGSAYGRL